METLLSSKGQLVLPAKVRKQLQLGRGERLTVEVLGDAVVLRRVAQSRRYKVVRHPVSGLPVMVAVRPPAHKVTPEEIARLHAALI